jgi:hypothetical protein
VIIEGAIRRAVKLTPGNFSFPAWFVSWSGRFQRFFGLQAVKGNIFRHRIQDRDFRHQTFFSQIRMGLDIFH